MTVELATIRLEAPKVRLKDPVFLLRVSVERERDAGQRIARSHRIDDLVDPVLRVLAASV